MTTSTPMREIVVVGCGVIGLTSALRLREAGFETRIVARDLPLRTTSSKAAAVWFPFQAQPPDKVRRWARYTYHCYGLLASLGADAGVRFVDLLNLSRVEEPDLFWLEDEYPLRWLRRTELPEGCAYGYSVVVPFIHSTVFLSFLLRTFLDLGGEVIEQEVTDLAEACPEGGALVHCTGLSAAELAHDREMFPIRGQVVRVRPRRPVRHIGDDSEPAQPIYVLPRGDDCILGGTAEAQVADETPNEETRDRILSRCRELEPALFDCELLESYVGLRPGRSQIRLEPEALGDGRTVIHNYGHGGSGFTLCWGCAEDVLALVRALA